MKSMIREKMKRLRDAMPPHERAKASKAICQQLFGLMDTKKRVLCYLPMGSEVNVKPVIAACPNCFVPKCVSRENMIAVAFGGQLAKSSFGVLEPIDSQEQTGMEIAIVPGLAFDRSLNRIGYGAGYYDRYLSAHPDIYRIAVCFDAQLVERIETTEYDVPMDVLVTPTQVIRKE